MSTLSRRDLCAVLAGVPLLRFNAAAAQPPVELSAGPLRMIFEPDLAMLRYIRLGDAEVVRGIFAPVRDRNWGTVEPRISNVKTFNRAGSFRVSFDVLCQAAPIDFAWKGLIVGERSGVVKFTFSGKARSTFQRNRIGFCVLHPIDGVAGTDCTVEHTGGAIEKGRFPDLISPHQPFFDIRAITHQAAPGAMVEVRMEGDTFEMEDQRNWTDGSYKTYCTPLAKPFPAEVKAGTLIEQSVTVRVKGLPKLANRGPAQPVRITIDETAAHPLPDIGLGIDGGPEPSPREIEWLRALRLGHVRAEVRIGDPEWDQAIGRAATLARSVASELELAVIASTSDSGTEYARVGRLLRDNSLRPRRLLMLHEKDASTSEASLKAAEQRIGGLLIPLGAGTRANFTELNRNRPAIDRCQFVAYPINPQVHAFDDASLVETLEIQAATLRTARSFSGQLPLVVAPVTFKQRFNPVATSADAAPPAGDPRQKTRFGACWTLGSIKYLAEGGAAAATYFDLTGDKGVVGAGRAYPMYQVFADVCDFAGGEALTARSTRKLDVECLALRKESNRRLLIANFRAVAQPVEIAVTGKWSMRKLDASTESAASTDPVAFRAAPGEMVEAKGGVIAFKLDPHSIVRLDRAG